MSSKSKRPSAALRNAIWPAVVLSALLSADVAFSTQIKGPSQAINSGQSLDAQKSKAGKSNSSIGTNQILQSRPTDATDKSKAADAAAAAKKAQDEARKAALQTGVGKIHAADPKAAKSSDTMTKLQNPQAAGGAAVKMQQANTPQQIRLNRQLDKLQQTKDQGKDQEQLLQLKLQQANSQRNQAETTMSKMQQKLGAAKPCKACL